MGIKGVFALFSLGFVLFAVNCLSALENTKTTQKADNYNGCNQIYDTHTSDLLN